MPDRVVRMELISFFHIHPHTQDTAEEVSWQLGRSQEQVRRQMEELERLCILRRVAARGEPRYRYIPPAYKPLGRKVTAARSNFTRLSVRSEDDHRRAGEAAAVGGGAEEDLESEVRMRLVIAAMKRQGWKECLDLLLDTIYRLEEVPCAAYLLVGGCTEIAWDSQRGSHGGKAGMSESDGAMSLVLEGELLKKKGLLETEYHVKYLYPVGDSEAILICADRDRHYPLKASLLELLVEDFMPVAAEMWRQSLMREQAAEKTIQECIFLNVSKEADIDTGLESTLASLAKGVDAERVSLLMRDETGKLRTLSVYGKLHDATERGDGFSAGRGVAGWCVENARTANLVRPRMDPRFVQGRYDDIESLLCCPIVLHGGNPIGVVCAVNKRGGRDGSGACFNDNDTRLQEGIAGALAAAFSSRGLQTRKLLRARLQRWIAPRQTH